MDISGFLGAARIQKDTCTINQPHQQRLHRPPNGGRETTPGQTTADESEVGEHLLPSDGAAVPTPGGADAVPGIPSYDSRSAALVREYREQGAAVRAD